MSSRRLTVFGGTGFLGRRIVRHLQDADFAVCIASRHPDRDRSLFSRDVSGIVSFRAEEPKHQSRPSSLCKAREDGAEDIRNRARRRGYLAAFGNMFAPTSIAMALWYVV